MFSAQNNQVYLVHKNVLNEKSYNFSNKLNEFDSQINDVGNF